MTTDVNNVLGVLVLIDRLLAMAQSLGARVRLAQQENRPITDVELDEQAQGVAHAIDLVRDEIAARRAGG